MDSGLGTAVSVAVVLRVAAAGAAAVVVVVFLPPFRRNSLSNVVSGGTGCLLTAVVVAGRDEAGVGKELLVLGSSVESSRLIPCSSCRGRQLVREGSSVDSSLRNYTPPMLASPLSRLNPTSLVL